MWTGLSKWVVVLLLCSFRTVVASGGSCHANDSRALLDFAGNITNGQILSNWIAGSDCCSWEGVSCAVDATANCSRVARLVLSGRSLTGIMSPSLGRLDRLTHLDLSMNLLGGEVPSEISSLAELEFLDLSYNELKGSFFGSAGDGLESLRWINISSNLFNGTLVGSTPSYPKLVSFNISNNSFGGPIETSICSRSAAVRVLDFSNNRFRGKISEGLGNCTSLSRLLMSSNFLCGELPGDLFNLYTLEELSIHSNNFSGGLSDRLGNFARLRSLEIFSNQFTGLLPDIFGNLTGLELLIAHSNLFSGRLPLSLGLCSSMRTLDLRNNSLTGIIGVDFTGMRQLRSLDFATNKFDGRLPSSLSNCKELKTLSIARNSLHGEIPEEFGTLQSLSFLSLSNNSFTNISKTLRVLQNCSNLTTLILTKNFKEELFPYDIEGFEKLAILAVGNCGLRGRVPEWLLQCRKLQVLDLSWNDFNGDIPSWIGEFEHLFYLDLSNNSLTGEIPMSLTQLRSLVGTTSSLNSSTYINIPLYVKRNQSSHGMQYNQVSGFPPSIYLSNNRLNGTIWPQFGQLKGLHVLDLSRNNITGTIPDSLSEMCNIEVLDLSFNDLHGSIPVSLNKLTFLSKFSVANNHLCGPVPTGGQLFSFSKPSFDGNPCLCDGPLARCNGTSLAEATSSLNNGAGRKSILGITISIGVGIALLLAVVLFNMSRNEVVSQIDEEEDEVAPPHITSDYLGEKLVLLFQNPEGRELTVCDLVKATNNFDQANIIGCGGFGLVYKANLPDGTKAAIKRLSGDCGQMEREFRAEVEALSKAQHKNLVSLRGYCRYGNDRLLIYSYMENGSLDYWLHERLDGGSQLDWVTRLRIAQGAAEGLAYLHKACVPNVVHRDVKSSNILLNGEFEPHLADFGLSRLLKPYDTHVTTDLVGTLGYIPPEYSQTMTATFKGDVYSFGVVILELLTGKRPVDVCRSKGCLDLVSWVRQMKTERKNADVFEPLIWKKENENELLTILDIAFKCISIDPKQRPSIEQVVSWLNAVGKRDESIK